MHPGSARADAARADAARADAARADAARADAVSVVALTADLPAMRPEDLESALVAAARTGRRAFVPDLEGTGTVLLAAPAGQSLTPHFGPGSAAAHLRSGAVRLDGAWPSLRRDVDTAADLDAAARLGLGAHTGQVICTVA
jgi:2-phospho-L-lactate guanylyltransferase